MSTATFSYSLAIGGESIPVASGRVSFDDSSAPAIIASFEVPFTPARRDLLNLRTRDPERSILTVTETRAGVARSSVLDLTTRSMTASHVAGMLTIVASSDEALLEDFRPIIDDYWPKRYAGSLSAVVRYVLNCAIAGGGARLKTDYRQPAVAPGADPDALVWREGVSALAFLVPIVQASGLRLVCDEQRVWTLRPETFSMEGDDGFLTLAEGLNLVDASDRVSRDDDSWFDAAVVRYEWTDLDGVSRNAVDRYRTPSYSKTRMITVYAPYPGPGFAEYAVRRAQTRGREVEATAMAMWRVRPEQFALLQLPETINQMGNTRRVDFSLDNDEMTVAARTIDTPDTAWVLIPVGVAWNDIPAGTSWQNFE